MTELTRAHSKVDRFLAEMEKGLTGEGLDFEEFVAAFQNPSDATCHFCRSISDGWVIVEPIEGMGISLLNPIAKISHLQLHDWAIRRRMNFVDSVILQELAKASPASIFLDYGDKESWKDGMGVEAYRYFRGRLAEQRTISKYALVVEFARVAVYLPVSVPAYVPSGQPGGVVEMAAEEEGRQVLLRINEDGSNPEILKLGYNVDYELAPDSASWVVAFRRTIKARS